MKIYTKTGDDGETGLFGGQRVAKHDTRVCAYGEVDEACSYLGVVRSRLPGVLEVRPELEPMLTQIQDDLFVLGADLATPEEVEHQRVTRVKDEQVARLEGWIDEIDGSLPPLSCFVLPGGHPLAAELFFSRTLVRRAERAVVALASTEPVSRTALLYLNRLSDLLFVLGRFVNHRLEAEEIPWKGGS